MITEDYVRSVLAEMERRVAEIKGIGGVARFDVFDGRAVVPTGWVLDIATEFYVPPWWKWEPDRKPS